MLTVIDLNQQQKLKDDPKAIQQSQFSGNLEEDNATKFFILEDLRFKPF